MQKGLIPIIGVSNVDQLKENLTNTNLTIEQINEIDSIIKINPIYPNTVNKSGGWLNNHLI